MRYVEIVEQIEQKADGKASGSVGTDEAGPLLAVKISGSVIGDYWLILDDTEPFDPGDELPAYRPSEIRALKGKGYGPEALQAINRVKVILDGRIVRE